MRSIGSNDGEEEPVRASGVRRWDDVPTRPNMGRIDSALPRSPLDQGRAADPWAHPRRERAGRTTARQSRRGPTLIGTWLRGLIGSLATGLAVLAVAIAAVQVWASTTGEAGPGGFLVVCHLLGGVIAVGLQGAADRRRDGVGGWCLLGALGAVLLTLTLCWWS